LAGSARLPEQAVGWFKVIGSPDGAVDDLRWRKVVGGKHRDETIPEKFI
jgi:hypothetical protein